LLNTVLGTLSSGVAASTSSYESIASVAGNGSATSLTFSSIPSTYKHLQIRGLAYDGQGSNIRLQFNSDTGSNYSFHYLRGSGSSATASGSATQTYIDYVGRAENNASIYGVSIIDIHDYASTTKNKTTKTFFGYDSNGGGIVYLTSGLWMSTSAISSISLINAGGFAFNTSSSFALYGIKG
jgi:hypothetical protein